MIAERDTSVGSTVAEEPVAEAQRLQRRVAHYRRMGMLNTSDQGLTISRALTVEDLRSAYRLVYRAYVEKRYILPNPAGIRLRPFEALAEMATYVAKVDGRVMAVMSIVPDTPELGLPSDKGFHEELSALRREGRRLAEVTNLAVDPACRNGNALFNLMQPIFAYGWGTRCDDIFIAISPGHARFFEEVVGFLPCGDRRSYSKELTDIVVGKRMDLMTIEQQWLAADRLLGRDAFLHDYFFRANPFHNHLTEDAMESRNLFCDPQFLTELFGGSAQAIAHWRPDEQSAVKARWPKGLLQGLLAPRPALRAV